MTRPPVRRPFPASGEWRSPASGGPGHSSEFAGVKNTWHLPPVRPLPAGRFFFMPAGQARKGADVASGAGPAALYLDEFLADP